MKSNFISKNRDHIKKLTAVGLFSALAYVCCVMFHFKAGFLTFDLKDAGMTVCGLIFGPLYGIACALIVAFIEAVTISDTAVYGFIMNVLSSCTFIGVSSIIYSRRRTIPMAVISMVVASLSTVGIMMVANLFITPYYMGVDRAAVGAMIPTLLLPFNATKAVFNSSVVFILYKPVVTAIRSSGFFKVSDGTPAKIKAKRTIPVTLIALIVATLTLAFFFVYLKGSFDFGA